MMRKMTLLSAVLVAALCAGFGESVLADPMPPGVADPVRGKCSVSEDKVLLDVTVSGVHSSKGEVAITIYKGRKAFLAPHRKFERIRTPAAPTLDVCFELPDPGEFGIAIYHDEDGNQKFNRTFVGLPNEGYGFSRDAPSSIGLPSYDDAKFTVKKGNNHQHITMRY